MKGTDSGLFPENLLTRKKASESYLATWLYRHEDYDDLPGEITYSENIESENNLIVLTFKFKSHEPHLLATKGWMLGYVGYTITNNKLYGKPDFITSDFSNVKLSLDVLQKRLNLDNKKAYNNA